jgi:predicted dehydrogenase
MGGALDAFCHAVRGLAPPVVTADDAIAATTCIDAAYESLRRGGWVKLAELEV